MPIDNSSLLRRAQDTFEIEAQALKAVGARVGPAFVASVQAILATAGRVVVTGMGKSGHVGRKIAATLASTGTPALFVHPAEASHGDLGMITARDVVLAISNSGESAELDMILPVVKRLGATLIGMTGGAQSSLARFSDWVLDTRVDKEACPLNLAPTSSTTVQMAMGDALAVALLEARGFGADDFARSHPGGSLGRKLLTLVSDVMRQGDAVPKVLPETPFFELMREMSKKGLGMAVVVNDQDQVQGVFTDGDLRRLLEQGVELRSATAAQVMRTQPRFIAPQALAADAADKMEQHRITSLLVCESKAGQGSQVEQGEVAGDSAAQGPVLKLVGTLHIGDLMRAKVI